MEQKGWSLQQRLDLQDQLRDIMLWQVFGLLVKLIIIICVYHKHRPHSRPLQYSRPASLPSRGDLHFLLWMSSIIVIIFLHHILNRLPCLNTRLIHPSYLIIIVSSIPHDSLTLIMRAFWSELMIHDWISLMLSGWEKIDWIIFWGVTVFGECDREKNRLAC